MQTNPLFLIDGYKSGHHKQYPKGTEFVYSNFTPRSSRVPGVNAVVNFGMQYFVKKYLIDLFQKNFFDRPLEDVVGEYKRVLNAYLGNDDNYEHIEALHKLGYLPISIYSIPEGEIVPIGVPVFTVVNTHKDFDWLTKYFETLMSNVLWKPITSATTANEYRKAFVDYAKITGYDQSFIDWQGHDFSFRGMSGNEDALMSGAAHLLSFTGTDTVPTIEFMEMFYNADCSKELVGGSVPATEHSVMSMGDEAGEIDTFKRLITEIYPGGIISIVSDTWDFWQVMTEFLPALKDDIMAREGRVVIRPDSGDPVKIICGDPEAKSGSPEQLGAFQILWDIFGGTLNKAGYRELDPHIGLIYGDSITLQRQQDILERLEESSFAANNLVLGIGSFTYEYVTRDTFGFSMKATWGMINGKPKDIFKDPKTNNGFSKKSAKGLLSVKKVNGVYVLKDQCTMVEYANTEMKQVFLNGELLIDDSLSTIRARLVQANIDNA